jgi:hypothetical protein
MRLHRPDVRAVSLLLMTRKQINTGSLQKRQLLLRDRHMVRGPLRHVQLF